MIEFAKNMLQKPDSYYKRIMRTDETKVQGWPNSEKVKGREIQKDTLKTSKKHNGGGGVMFWGAISWYAFGPLVIKHGYITGAKYLEFLKDFVVPEMRASNVELVFQQDNASSHTEASVKEFLAN